MKPVLTPKWIRERFHLFLRKSHFRFIENLFDKETNHWNKMLHLELICGVFCLLLGVNMEVMGDRTNNKIYININGNSACFRRLNATHQIGCASVRGGNVGVLHYISTPEDITWLVEKGIHAPYAALLTPAMFTEPYVKELQASGKINSMLIIFSNKTDTPASFSADTSCPNDRYGIYHDTEYADCKTTTWNPSGSGFMFRDFPFPIMTLTNETEVQILIQQCYEKFNKPGLDGAPREYPLCSAQVKDEMDAAKDTPTCVRRSNLLQGLNREKYCDPLGNHNTFAFTRPITFQNPVEDHKIIIAAARLDGFSMFNDIYTNSEGTVSGIVTLLGAAYAIGKVKESLGANHKPIMFAFFNGEAYDYIGSGRIVYDMEKGVFPTSQKELPKGIPDSAKPIMLNNIHSFLEVSQVGKPLTEGEMWIHKDPLSKPDTGAEVDKMIKMLQQAGNESGMNMRTVPENQPLPSASVQSFLKKRKIPGVVVADHEKEFTNKYYNSRFDLPSVMNADYPKDLPENATYDYVTDAAAHLQKVATTVAKALYTMSTGKTDTSTVSVDNVTMANLLNCYLHRGDCELFYQLEEPGRALQKKPYLYYVGVSVSYLGPHNITRYTHRTLSYFLGDHFNVSKTNCTEMEKADQTHDYTFVGGPMGADGKRSGLCVRSTANTSLARSAAFDKEDYDWKSGQYSSWTESQWQVDAMSLRVFLVPSRQREIMTLCVGIALFVFSIATTYLLHKRAPVMFRPLRTTL